MSFLDKEIRGERITIKVMITFFIRRLNAVQLTKQLHES